MDKKYYTISELAKILNISRQAVFNKIKKGQIKAEKIGRNFAIPKLSLEEVVYGKLTDELKREIEQGVGKVVKEYGETLKLLGKE
ncbi:MAG: helix-turn-helix domain-containing protein [Candidatus Portnoybacteria bacterium]